MKKTKPSALQSLKLALAEADKTLQVAKAALADLIQAQANAMTATETGPTAAAAILQSSRVDGLPSWSRRK